MAAIYDDEGYYLGDDGSDSQTPYDTGERDDTGGYTGGDTPSFPGLDVPGYGGGAGGYPNYPTTGDPSTGGSGAGGMDWTAIVRALTGGGGYGSLLAMLAPALGGALRYRTTNRASDQMQNAAKDANALVSGIYGKSEGMYMPYVNAGQSALKNAQGLIYQPLGSRSLTLGQLGRGR